MLPNQIFSKWSPTREIFIILFLLLKLYFTTVKTHYSQGLKNLCPLFRKGKCLWYDMILLFVRLNSSTCDWCPTKIERDIVISCQGDRYENSQQLSFSREVFVYYKLRFIRNTKFNRFYFVLFHTRQRNQIAVVLCKQLPNLVKSLRSDVIRYSVYIKRGRSQSRQSDNGKPFSVAN